MSDGVSFFLVFPLIPLFKTLEKFSQYFYSTETQGLEAGHYTDSHFKVGIL